MNRDLLSQLQSDLKIKQYEGELDTRYRCRLIYSALAEWLRFVIFVKAGSV